MKSTLLFQRFGCAAKYDVYAWCIKYSIMFGKLIMSASTLLFQPHLPPLDFRYHTPAQLSTLRRHPKYNHSFRLDMPRQPPHTTTTHPWAVGELAEQCSRIRSFWWRAPGPPHHCSVHCWNRASTLCTRSLQCKRLPMPLLTMPACG